MPTVQTGARGTIDLLDDLIVPDIVRGVAQLEPDAGPLCTLLFSLEKVFPCSNAEPQHIEDESVPDVDLVTGAHTAAATALNVDNPTWYLVGDILHVPRTGENMRVTVAPGVSPLTVSRGVGGTPPAALVDDDGIWNLGGASAEGAQSRVAINTLEIPFTSFCQIIRNSIEGTGTALATEMYGGTFEEHAAKAIIQHKKQIDKFLKFGQQDRVQVGNEWLRTMGGLYYRTQTNRMSIGGVLGEGEFDLFCEMGYQYGSPQKVLIAAPRVVRAINNFAKARLVTVPEDESYGLAMQRYHSPAGIVDIVSDRELKGSVYGGLAFLVDLEYIIVRYLRAENATKTRSAKYTGNMLCKRITDIQLPDSDTRKDEIFSELTVQFIHERVNALLTDVQG